MTRVKEDIKKSFENYENLIFTFFIKENFCAFQGHFPHRPLLPGIVQIEMAMFCINKLLNRENVVLKGVKKIKFIKPILPNSRIFIAVAQTGESFKIIIKDEKEIYSQMNIEVT
ncbi:hypothetical protein [Endomicrobium proavitum]|uniref:Putative (3R)-hydroxymyristoyl-(Acyl carrier protein) dehydratase n=1 Tax=Endomicrobium proavitum TaxID=1408281 RepID=A0A0G3WK93_9BACT|nr:hypothetical protein [Endomicrobium proavitum]AKL98320.1 putative (3R)-hydroxymyristoyl-(acyl carrier protein) dehydratase [Endomicrobium proavitum]